MFGKRFHLLYVRGISIGFDLSWFFIAILLTWTLAAGYFPFYYPGFDGISYFIMGLTGMLGLFISVVLHELGHAFTAQRFGLPISSITLFMFGGIAELKEEPPNPKAEFLVAVAGPLVSLALACFFGIISIMGISLSWPTSAIAVISYLAGINLLVLIFNLIPAFPLDGGRMFRSFLWWIKGSLEWATKISSGLGAGFGFALIFLGILVLINGNFITGMWWMILGFFLQQAASMSRTQYYIKKELLGEKVEKYMVRDPHTVSPDISIQEFIDEYVYKTHHHFYPVVRGEEALGYVTLKEVKGIDREKWVYTKVQDIYQSVNKVATLTPQTDLLIAFNLLKNAPVNTLLVIENQQLVGLLSESDLIKIISLKLELED